MKQSRRGFHYPLDPLRRKGAWEADALKADLACKTAQVGELAQALQRAERALTEAGRLMVTPGGVLNPRTLQLQAGFVSQLAARREDTRQALSSAQAACDDALTAYSQKKKFLNGLDEHRNRAIQEHDKQASALESNAMDDFWLQSRHWKEVNKCA